MANEFFTILTATGRNKLAAATATATPLALTQMAVGDGDPATPGGAYYSPTEAQTVLKHEVWRGAINHLAVDANNPNWIVAELVIPDDVGSFYIREVGLFDSAGAMIAVGKFPESYKPTLAAGSNKQLYVRMILEVSNTTAVTLLVDPSVVLATRQYCDDKVAAEINKLDGKQSVRVATTAAIALSGLLTIDGVVLAAGDRVLVKNQATTKDNGIYVAVASVWSRAGDADLTVEITPGMVVSVEQGTANADSVWMLVTDGPITLGVTNLSFDWIGRRGLAPLASPAFTGNPTAPTPMQFRSDASLATTLFVQRALGNVSKLEYISSSQPIDPLSAGSLFVLSGEGGSISLPAVTACVPGAVFHFCCGSGDWVVNITGSDVIAVNESSANSLPVKGGDTLVLVSQGSGGVWRVIGGSAQFRYAPGFGSSLGVSGYQKLPGGLIIQWGSFGYTGGSGGAIFPIAFTTACYAISLGQTDSVAGPKAVVSAKNTSGFSVVDTDTMGNATEYIAIGK